jgi:DNA-binding NarL/FixJ family response regulator
MPIKLFIVDDHYMVIEGLRTLLQFEKTIEWMGHAMNATSAKAFLQNQVPDVILMDINLPDQSGVDLCKEVKELYPTIKIIGLSTFNQLSYIENMIQNGASGYLLKNATKEEMLVAISEVMTGNQFLSHEVEDVLGSKTHHHPSITRREKEVLELIAQGMTNPEIADKIFVSVSTVDTHRKNLILKLEAKNTADLIRLAFQFNLLK